jgi:hypothetical protein
MVKHADERRRFELFITRYIINVTQSRIGAACQTSGCQLLNGKIQHRPRRIEQ